MKHQQLTPLLTGLFLCYCASMPVFVDAMAQSTDTKSPPTRYGLSLSIDGMRPRAPSADVSATVSARRMRADELENEEIISAKRADPND